VLRLYRIITACGLVVLLATSVSFSLLPDNATRGPFAQSLVTVYHCYIWELIAALASIAVFAIRTVYLLFVFRFRDAAIDAVLAGVAAIIFYASIMICPAVQ